MENLEFLWDLNTPLVSIICRKEEKIMGSRSESRPLTGVGSLGQGIDTHSHSVRAPGLDPDPGPRAPKEGYRQKGAFVEPRRFLIRSALLAA